MSSNKVLKSNSMFKWLIWLFRRAKKTLQTRPSRATVSLRGGDRPQTQVSYTWQDPDLSVPKWQTTLNINKTSHIGIPYASVEPWTRKKEKNAYCNEEKHCTWILDHRKPVCWECCRYVLVSYWKTLDAIDFFFFLHWFFFLSVVNWKYPVN